MCQIILHHLYFSHHTPANFSENHRGSSSNQYAIFHQFIHSHTDADILACSLQVPLSRPIKSCQLPAANNWISTSIFWILKVNDKQKQAKDVWRQWPLNLSEGFCGSYHIWLRELLSTISATRIRLMTL